MTPALLAELSRLPLFPRTARELIQVAGLEATAQLIKACPGQNFPVPMRVGGGNPEGVRRWAHLVEIVGEPAATRIVKWRPGADMFVPNLKKVIWSRNQDLIRAEFDRLTTTGGYSMREARFELGVKYDCSHAAIDAVLKRLDNQLGDAAALVPAQGALF